MIKKITFLAFLLLALQYGSAQNNYELNSGWKYSPVKNVKSSGVAISLPAFSIMQWKPATVPGTILTNLLNNEEIPDPFLILDPFSVFAGENLKKFAVVRVSLEERNFNSDAIEKAITDFSKHVKDPELTWLFNNCFPNTLDTTVDFQKKNENPDTYVITGDIDAMWLRDSSAQVWPYMAFLDKDKHLQDLIAGVINRQKKIYFKRSLCQCFLQRFLKSRRMGFG